MRSDHRTVERKLERLRQNQFDVLVIGAGIHGACVARDAALRGLRVALIDRGDFGAETSSNSLKTMHGGLRYLQTGNMRLAHRMIQERKAWLKTASLLVKPQPFLLPVNPHSLTRNKAALFAALKLNDWIGAKRNHGVDRAQNLPPSRIVHADELRTTGIDGIGTAALWYDAQMINSERLLLSAIISAQQHGAVAVNYVEMTDFIWTNRAVTGGRARDIFSGQSLSISAHMTVICAGRGTDTLHQQLSASLPRFKPSLAINVVTRQIVPDYALGVTGPSGQTFFIVPWLDYSLIGTLHLAVDQSSSEGGPVKLEVVRCFLDEINAAYPPARLTLDDVRRVHWGFLPTADGHTRLLREGQVHDHAAEANIEGVITVLGVKYTSARMVAEWAVDRAFRKLGMTPPPCRTQTETLTTADLSPVQADAGKLLQSDRLLTEAIRYAVQHEMAFSLADVLMRRTAIASAERPDQTTIRRCAEIMAVELGWSMEQQQQEIRRFEHGYPDLRRLQ